MDNRWWPFEAVRANQIDIKQYIYFALSCIAFVKKKRRYLCVDEYLKTF